MLQQKAVTSFELEKEVNRMTFSRNKQYLLENYLLESHQLHQEQRGKRPWTYYNTTPLGFTFDDLQRICYHLQHAEKENKLTDKDMGTLLKARAMVLVHEEEKNQLIYAEKTKILNMYSSSHYEKLRRSISVKFLNE